MRQHGIRNTAGGVVPVMAALLALVALVAVGVVATAGSADAVTRDWRLRMLDKVNAVRAAAGVPPVHLCRHLQQSAQAYAQQMASTATFGHQGPDGRLPADRMAATGYRGTMTGENIGAGQATVVQVMRQWRASPNHYATMTDPRLYHVGFGYATSDRSTYPTYWVQNYGAGGTC